MPGRPGIGMLAPAAASLCDRARRIGGPGCRSSGHGGDASVIIRPPRCAQTLPMPAVRILPWSDAWPADFGHIRDALRAAFAPCAVQIEHIGSTAVPGLDAKPVIDVLVGVGRLTEAEAAIPALAARGFVYVPKYERELPMRRYFVRDATAETPRAHVHAVETGSAIWRRHLAFRDALRADPALREAYRALKLRLAREHADDKAAYTAAKDPFIRAVLDALDADTNVGQADDRPRRRSLTD
jgi:GrpB-like predicted nucleotidyltransferase (UPF0157 family)